MSTIVSRNPARPGEVVGSLPRTDEMGVDRQIGAAAVAVAGWSADAPARSVALQRWADKVEARSDELVGLLTAEVGKPVRESRAEVARAIAILRYYAQAVYEPIAEGYPSAAGAELVVHRRPHGVVSILCPWNFPIAIPAWKIAPALAYGNTVLFRPSSEAAVTGSLLIEAALDAIPDDVLQLVLVDHDAGRALVEDDRVRAVSFTGSVPVGMDIVRRSAGRGIPVQAEMGGQNASIVLDDADLAFAATTIAHAAMEFAGQKCTATRRAIVLREVADAFTEQLVSAVQALHVGDPANEATNVGPVISVQARDSIGEAIGAAEARGARRLTQSGSPAEGWYLTPAVLQIDDPTDAFVMEETFGPAVAVLTVDSEDEAIALANSTRFGLSGAVFSRDLHRGRGLAARLDAGLQRVNAPTTGVDFHVPFGGEKASGYGPREQGHAARDFFTHTRTMLIHPSR